MSLGNQGLRQRASDNAQADVQAYTSFKFVASTYKQEYNNLSCLTAVFMFTLFRHNP